MEWRRNEEIKNAVLVREDSRRKCGELVVVKRVNVEGVKKEGMIMEWKGNGGK